MFKKTSILLTVICTGLVLFTTNVVASDKLEDQVITSDELQQMSELRNKMIQSNTLGLTNLTKVPSMLDENVAISELKKYKQSLALKNKLMEKNQLTLSQYGNGTVLKKS